MGRILALAYGLAAYVVFFGTILYAIGFVTGLYVPKTIDTGPEGPILESLVINVLLMSLFAVQHSVMARQGFKRWWTRFVPAAVERSTFVLVSSLALILLFWQWRPIGATIWEVSEPRLAMALLGLSLFGWGIVFLATFLINHFELFGLSQVVLNLIDRKPAEPRFRTPLLYRFVRHPLYLGFIIAFWATPVMSVGHLLFAAVTTAYIFVGIALEERDLIALYGNEYRRYRQRVAMLFPLPRRSSPERTSEASSASTARADAGDSATRR
ncbi:MAG: isoprenylcysteine carboxylmethyltransferase family protein [Hyphomicrobiaceae bacterium]|nr:isoprenylcysteine carboxylmethyltransferase family protein [Hyphomicrobiaceae bacterium]